MARERHPVQFWVRTGQQELTSAGCLSAEFAGQIRLSHSHFAERNGALAQLGERLICIQEVRSSILLGSTNFQRK